MSILNMALPCWMLIMAHLTKVCCPFSLGFASAYSRTSPFHTNIIAFARGVFTAQSEERPTESMAELRAGGNRDSYFIALYNLVI